MKVTLALLACSVPFISAEHSSPVGKAIQLLSDMQTKIIGEGEEAQKVYAKNAEWCEERSKNHAFEIKTAKAEIAQLKATIEEETALAASLNTKVETLTDNIATDEADLKAATAIRTKEATDFAAEEKELAEVIDSLRRAVGILEKEMQKGGASMMQVKNAGSLVKALSILVQSSSLASADADRLTALVQSSDESDDVGAPAATVYDGHSGGIIETLEGLLEKAEGQLDDARKKETSGAHNFAMLKQSLQDEIKFANKDLSKAQKSIAQSGEEKSNAEGDLQVTAKDLKASGGSLDDLHQTCMTKAQDYEAETRSRGEELQAIGAAKTALTENTGAADSQAYGLNQASFLQLSRSSLSSGVDLAHFEAVHLVRDLARKERSTGLAQLASRMASAMRLGSAAGDDPFAKVKGLVVDMIEKLEAEAQNDASHKAYCDKELAESNTKKDDKASDIEKLSTKIDQMTSRSAQLKSEVAGLQKALSQLASASAEMDAIRRQEHQDFKEYKADIQQGLEGVKMALKALRDFYGKDGKDHSAAEGAGSSVIGLLEVVESDFSKGLAEMTATEESSQSTYETETKENEIEKVSKEQDVSYRSKESNSLDKAVAETTSDRSGVQTEHDAVTEYLDTLKKQCTSKVDTYSERKARFEAELTGLKDALRILESETVLLQQGERRSLRGIHTHDPTR